MCHIMLSLCSLAGFPECAKKAGVIDRNAEVAARPGDLYENQLHL